MRYFSPKIIFLSLFWPLMVYAQNHVGIILSGHEDDCEVNHLGTVYECIDRRELFIGDTVKKKPSVKSLKIKWAPYVKGAERGQTYLEVVASKPETLKGSSLTGAMKQYVNDFVRTPAYGTTTAATRDPKTRFTSFATLLYDHPWKISKSGEDRFVSILDSRGKKVWGTQVKGGEELLVDPKGMPLNPTEKYTLIIEGTGQRMASTMTLMDEMLQNEVKKGFTDIERENSAVSDLIIKKVAYCQLISDVYPDKIDLYWLGNQLLEEHPLPASEDQKEVVERLKQRYLNHLRKTE
jgi:hypothetical protein